MRKKLFLPHSKHPGDIDSDIVIVYVVHKNPSVGPTHWLVQRPRRGVRSSGPPRSAFRSSASQKHRGTTHAGTFCSSLPLALETPNLYLDLQNHSTIQRSPITENKPLMAPKARGTRRRADQIGLGRAGRLHAGRRVLQGSSSKSHLRACLVRLPVGGETMVRCSCESDSLDTSQTFDRASLAPESPMEASAFPPDYPAKQHHE